MRNAGAARSIQISGPANAVPGFASVVDIFHASNRSAPSNSRDRFLTRRELNFLKAIYSRSDRRSDVRLPQQDLVGIQRRAQALIRQQVLEIGDGLNKTFLELRPWRPVEFFLGLGNVRTPLARIVLRKWLVDDLGR